MRDVEALFPFLRFAFRSSLCFRRNSALSAFETPSSTRLPFALPLGAFYTNHARGVGDVWA